MLRRIAGSTSVSVPLAALVVLVSGCGSSGSAQVVGASTAGPAGATSGAATGDLLVTGRVLDEGRPVAGAEVNVLVYPARPDPEATDPTPGVQVPPVTTGEAGRYAVTLAGEEVPDEYLVPLPDGSPRLEFAVVVADGDRVSSWSEVAALVAAGGGSEGRVWRTPGRSGADAVLRIDLDLGDEVVTVSDSAGDQVVERLPSR